MANRVRNIRKEINLTSIEDAKIKNKIRQSNLKTFQGYALKMLLEGQVTVVDYSELINLRRDISAIGNNINQIAKYINLFEEVDQEMIKSMQSDIKELNHLVKKELKKGGKKR